MQNGQSIAVAVAFCVLTGMVAAQGQAPVPPAGGRGGGQGRGGQSGGGAAPARGVTINQNVIQKASAKIAGEQISGTVEFNEYQVANGGLIQVVYNLQGVRFAEHRRQATGAVTLTSYTTRFNLGGPLSPLDADGAALVIHQNPDTYQTGTKGQGVGGGHAIACGVIVK
jgi:hypothetical protein